MQIIKVAPAISKTSPPSKPEIIGTMFVLWLVVDADAVVLEILLEVLPDCSTGADGGVFEDVS